MKKRLTGRAAESMMSKDEAESEEGVFDTALPNNVIVFSELAEMKVKVADGTQIKPGIKKEKGKEEIL